MVNKRRRVGFTIVELVIVIAVIAVLAAILIPTFVSITKKANLSADMVAVREMNGILAAEEITDGKPATVVDAKAVLTANGINDFTPMSANSEFYWLGSDNRVILWEWENDEKTTGEVTYPDEYVKKYKDVSTPSAAWEVLSITFDDTNYIEIEPVEGESLKTTVINTIKNAPDGAIIKLPENSVMDLGKGGLSFLSSAIKNDSGLGKNISIDLNGSIINSLDKHDNGWYYSLKVADSGTLQLINGSLNINMWDEETAAQKTQHSATSAVSVETGASLVLKNMNIKSNGATIFPAGTASEVVIDNCTIEGVTYGVGTNRVESDKVKIRISGSTIKSGGVAVHINCTSDTIIENSELIADGWGIIVRAGHVSIKNSSVTTTEGDVGTGSTYSCGYADFSYTQSSSGAPYWGQGYQQPYAVVSIGDYSNGSSYSGDAVVEMANVELVSANPNDIPNVLLAANLADKNVILNYDEATNIGKVVVFGDDYVRAGVSHTFNHPGTIKINDDIKLKYAIASDFGTFAAGSELNAADLNTNYTDQGYDYAANIKAYLIEKYDTFDSYTDVEWEKLNLWFSSGTNGDLKGYYDESGNTVALTRENLITKGIISGDCPVKLLNRVNFASLKKETTVRNCLNELKLYCEKIGLEITEEQWSNVKIVIGETNTIVDIVVE